MKKCKPNKHDKVFANELLLSDPPQQKWICRKCKYTGIDVISEPSSDEYDKLMRQKYARFHIKPSIDDLDDED